MGLIVVERERNEVGRLVVSRETFDRLKTFESSIVKWNPKINLVSKSSLADVWTRHIVDSVQVWEAARVGTNWFDLGSGGGFPGLFIAALMAEHSPGGKVTLVESDKRKSAFLRSAAREMSLDVTVISERIESIPPAQADVLSARALADLSKLLAFVELHLAPSGVAVFPKGESWKNEVDKARQEWRFDLESSTSWTEPRAAVLRITGVSRV